MEKLKSLKVIFSLIVACIITILSIVLVASSYAIAYSAIENSFLNQLYNFNSDFSRQLVNFYEQQINTCRYFASSKVIRDAVLTGKYNTAIDQMTVFFNETRLYENIFISTASQDTVIVADGIKGKSVGLHWRDTGFNDNLNEALKGNVHISEPNKSPVNGRGVVVITAPIINNGRVIAIMGLPCDVGSFSANLVGNTVIGKTGYPFITDFNGRVFAHPQSDLIYKLDMSKEVWGKPIFESNKEKDIVRYEWQGKSKILAWYKNKKYKFITCVTIYTSDINQSVIRMAIIMVIVGVIGIVLSAALIYIIISRRLKPLDECKIVMNSMAEGRLNIRYSGKKSDDEIGEIASFMNSALDRFQLLIVNVKSASLNLTQAVKEIAGGNQNLSQRTSEQASALEEIASTIEETAQNINQNAMNSREANTLVKKSTDLALNGGALVSEAVTSINEIYSFSKKINEIINVINEIAFQTNLLALNAAVEAARAGEQGRGFAVVAAEVRNLAQRSSNAAKEISSLIQEANEKIKVGTQKANLSGQSLTEIIESIKTVNRMISEMAVAGDEQKQGINQINIAVSELDSMTQQNAALVEQTAAASEEMSSQAMELESMMKVFSTD